MNKIANRQRIKTNWTKVRWATTISEICLVTQLQHLLLILRSQRLTWGWCIWATSTVEILRWLEPRAAMTSLTALLTPITVFFHPTTAKVSYASFKWTEKRSALAMPTLNNKWAPRSKKGFSSNPSLICQFIRGCQNQYLKLRTKNERAKNWLSANSFKSVVAIEIFEKL